MPSADLIARLPGHPIVVVGDVMLDHFLIGQVQRISPEAPVPVVKFVREEFRLGGAANVANNVASLGGKVTLIGLVGTDEAAEQVRRLMAARSLDSAGLITSDDRPTTRKMRVVTDRNQQVARIDYEHAADPPATVGDALIAQLQTSAATASALVVSDYRKGVVSEAIIAASIEAGRRAGIPVLVDPKTPEAERYRGASVLTPNHHEAELMTRTAIRTPDDARRAAARLRALAGCSVVMTWGEHGMWVHDAVVGDDVHLHAAAREVADVTGAGDTVIAALALGLAAGASLADAARLATRAAGLVVGRFGPAVVGPDDLLAPPPPRTG